MSILQEPDGLWAARYPPSKKNGFKHTAIAGLPNGERLVVQGTNVLERLLTILHAKGVPTIPIADNRMQPIWEYTAYPDNHLGLDDSLSIEEVLKAAGGRIKRTKKRVCDGCGKPTGKAAQAKWCPSCKRQKQTQKVRNWRAKTKGTTNGKE